MRNLLRVTMLCLSFVAITSCDKVNDFDTVCSYFDLLAQENKVTPFNSDQMFEFINDRITKNIAENNSARDTWNAVVGFEPVEGRYVLYKAAAEVTIKTDWECDSMRLMLKDI